MNNIVHPLVDRKRKILVRTSSAYNAHFKRHFYQIIGEKKYASGRVKCSTGLEVHDYEHKYNLLLEPAPYLA